MSKVRIPTIAEVRDTIFEIAGFIPVTIAEYDRSTGDPSPQWLRVHHSDLITREHLSRLQLIYPHSSYGGALDGSVTFLRVRVRSE